VSMNTQVCRLPAIVARRNRVRGITLIEMLIAVLVLSFGLLGLAGLQALSLKNNQSAYLRSQATMLGYEILDRLRADRENAINGDYNTTDASILLGGVGFFSAASFSRYLPEGEGQAACDGGTRICTVVIRWNDLRVASAPISLVFSTQL
jgi:type IV pilus assembly protein PilV